MSDTPRTDAVALHRDVFRRNGNEGDILTDFARTLEREFAAERAAREKAEVRCAALASEGQRMTIRAEKAEAALTEWQGAAVKSEGCRLQAERHLDAARAALIAIADGPVFRSSGHGWRTCKCEICAALRKAAGVEERDAKYMRGVSKLAEKRIGAAGVEP